MAAMLPREQRKTRCSSNRFGHSCSKWPFPMTISINNKKDEVFLVEIDPSDFPTYKKYKWSIYNGYVQTNIKDVTGRSSTRRLHQILMNPSSGFMVDHIDLNKLNNRRNNLRICTNAENQRNRVRPANNTSGFKGVYFNKGRNKYASQIRYDNKKKFLGYFTSAIDAAKAYDLAAKRIFGQFARLNI